MSGFKVLLSLLVLMFAFSAVADESLSLNAVPSSGKAPLEITNSEFDDSYNIFPNPANDFIDIETKEITDISVFDAIGLNRIPLEKDL